MADRRAEEARIELSGGFGRRPRRHARPAPAGEAGDTGVLHCRDVVALAHAIQDEFPVSSLDAERIARAVLARFGTALPPAAPEPAGLHGKYLVTRSRDGSAIDFPAFVLRVDGEDPAAMAALRAYAQDPSCSQKLAADLTHLTGGPAPAAELSDETIAAQALGRQGPVPGAADDITDENGKRWDRTMDAALWAKAFCAIFPGGDEGLMLAWFANAIMAGWDHQRWKIEAELRPVPVAERRPDPRRESEGGDCDPYGQCWAWDWLAEKWVLVHFRKIDGYEFWLRASALPVPEAAPEFTPEEVELHAAPWSYLKPLSKPPEEAP